jgi:hypothetical protein
MVNSRLFRRIFPRAKWRCLECYASQETRFLKPKGWLKKKTRDGNILVFCSQKCMEKWFGGSMELRPWSKRLHARMLLVVTAVPAVLFIIFLLNIIWFYIKMGGGSFLVDWHNYIIGVESQGAGTGINIWFFVLGLICTPLFITSILLLYKERQSRKKRKAEKLMAYTV